MESDIQACDQCGQHVHIDDLDFKPLRFNRWWWHLLPLSWAWKLLEKAADTGEQFDGGYCKPCYGPGYLGVYAERHGE